jgi:TRAP-type transport system periplasmic protein
MFTNRLFYLLIIGFLIVTACTPQVPATSEPTSAPDQPITLRLAVADAQDRPSTPYVLEFIEQVKTLSDGNITIEPIWDAGADTTPVFEQGVVKVVKEGQYDLGLAGSRAWDSLGVTSFQVLQAPFLITNDALAEAVAASDIGTRMLEGLSSAGAVGLVLWPEDLRHPFSVVPGEPILSPEDFEGATVRVVPSEITHMLIETLGGTPMFGDGDYQAAESGLRQGFSLTGTPTATGNVIFFPKFQVLFANGPAFEKLSETQRSILREAAAATQQKAIAEHPTESDAAAAWCADGGTVVMASDEQVAAFEAAAQPVFAKIEQDPLNAELIAAIRELKAKTEPAPGAEACQPEVAQPSAMPTAENQTWSTGLPPNGTWQAERTTDDFLRTGMLPSVAETEYAGVYTITFKDGEYVMIWEGLQGQLGRCEAVYELVEEDIVRLTYDPNVCSNPPEDIQWRIDDEGLHLHLVASNGGPPEVEWKPFYEAKPWQPVEEWSQGLPPNGVWRVELTVDDFVRMGVLRSVAEAEWAGTYTLTLKDGKSVGVWQGLQGQTGKCQANYEVVENFVRFTYYTDTDECLGEVDDLQWRLDDEGLHFHVIDIKNAPFTEIKAYLEAKPWQKIADQ